MHSIPARTPLRTALAATAALALATALGACGTTDGDSGGEGGGSVRIGTLRGQPHLYHPYFMERFAAEGQSFEIVLFDSSPDIRNAITSGAIDYGVLGAPSVLAADAAGEDIHIIASAANGGSGFVGSPDITTPEELRGAKIGYPAGSSQEILLKLTLEANGLDPESDVELVNLQYSDMAGAYDSGQIDAFLGAETGTSLAVHSGAHEILSPYDTPIGGVNIVLATGGEGIEEDPEAVQSVVDTFVQAVDLMNADRQAWVDGLVETFGLDPEVTASATENITPRWELDEDYREQVGVLAEQMVAFDQIAGEPDVGRVIDTTFVEAAAPAAE